MGSVSNLVSHCEPLLGMVQRYARHRYVHQQRGVLLPSLLVAMSLLISGCVERGANHSSSMQLLQMSLPQSRVVDYHIADCDVLWYWNEKETVENPLYWLRAMDCADRMNSPQIKTLSQDLSTEQGWANILRRTILLGNTASAGSERRQLINDINNEWQQFPGSLRPLLLLWRNQQTLQIALLDERTHYQRLQDNSESELEELRQSQGHLKNRLEETTRKLENLTDIERQLSSRKQLQSELPENNGDKTATSATSVDKTGGDSRHPVKTDPAKIDVKDTKVDNTATVIPEKIPEKKEQPQTNHSATSKPAEVKLPAATLSEIKPAETKPAETKPAETKPAESKSPESKPAHVEPSNTQSSTDKPVEKVPQNPTQPASPATNKEPATHDTTQTGQSTAG